MAAKRARRLRESAQERMGGRRDGRMRVVKTEEMELNLGTPFIVLIRNQNVKEEEEEEEG